MKGTNAQDRMKMLEERRRRLAERMSKIKHKFVVLSGKGGVGKSTVAAYLASALARRGLSVGLLDADIHGPSIPKLLGLEGERISIVGDTILPVNVTKNLRVMSIGFLLRSKSDAVIWRGPLKMTMIEEFLGNVDWGPLDYLIIDSPPGTGDEPLSICQLVPNIDGAIIVATPQEVALSDVEKSITFCNQVRLPVAGVIENMSGLVCPHCGKEIAVFKTGGAEALARRLGVPFLGRIPLVPEVVDACDSGKCTLENVEVEPLKQALEELTTKIAAFEAPDREVSKLARAEKEAQPEGKPQQETSLTSVASGSTLRIALPLDGNVLSSHFGHSREFAIIDVSDGKVISEKRVVPPPHAPGAIPVWLKEQGVDVVIACGLGRRALSLLEKSGIKTVTGAPQKSPQEIVNSYLEGKLETGDNVCDH